MPMDETVEHLREGANLVIGLLGKHCDFEFGLNRASVEWATGFIERQRVNPELQQNPPSSLVTALGAFLGECIAVETGGKWRWSEDGNYLGVAFDTPTKKDIHVFPINKVMKQFQNGLEGGDSILSMFDFAASMTAGALENAKIVYPKSV
jgi:hypothetical protein